MISNKRQSKIEEERYILNKKNHGELRHSTSLAMQHITTPVAREGQDARKPGNRRQRWISG